jgi:hypothetical protein
MSQSHFLNGRIFIALIAVFLAGVLFLAGLPYQLSL